MKNFEWIDHTADVGVRVCAKNLKTLFKNAAAVMFKLIAKSHKNILPSHARSFPLKEMTGGRKIKIHAVTYHELKIQKENSFYSAQIIFDV